MGVLRFECLLLVSDSNCNCHKCHLIVGGAAEGCNAGGAERGTSRLTASLAPEETTLLCLDCGGWLGTAAAYLADAWKLISGR